MDRVYFSDSFYEVYESDEMLEVELILQRPKNVFRDVSVRVRTRDLTAADSAIGLV